MGDINGWTLSDHAVARALDMAVDAAAIRRVLESPEVKQPSTPGYGADAEIWTSGKIACVVHPVDRVVITVLWRGKVYVRGTDSEPYRDN